MLLTLRFHLRFHKRCVVPAAGVCCPLAASQSLALAVAAAREPAWSKQRRATSRPLLLLSAWVRSCRAASPSSRGQRVQSSPPNHMVVCWA
mmetsp:Transcript_15538/g.58917  ORF Transcript_15538/g.58917 Transcript_15538/m.58917 type:complete len:91 (+) Transcript_15538:1325-1597(+)